MDVPIFLIYFYIIIYVCVPHFYYLSALVGCWFSLVGYVSLLFNAVSATIAIQRRPFSRLLRHAGDTEDVFAA